MVDHESIIIHATQIEGQSYPDDYTVIWRGLPIGRIRKNPGLPDYVDQWSWGCNVYGQQSVRGTADKAPILRTARPSLKLLGRGQGLGSAVRTSPRRGKRTGRAEQKIKDAISLIRLGASQVGLASRPRRLVDALRLRSFVDQKLNERIVAS